MLEEFWRMLLDIKLVGFYVSNKLNEIEWKVRYSIPECRQKFKIFHWNESGGNNT